MLGKTELLLMQRYDFLMLSTCIQVWTQLRVLRVEVFPVKVGQITAQGVIHALRGFATLRSRLIICKDVLQF